MPIGVKLTCVPHPDMNGGTSKPIYVSRDHVLSIAPATKIWAKLESEAAHHQALEGLYDEVQRVVAEANKAPSMVPETEEDARKIDAFMRAREHAAALQAAYGLVVHAAKGASYHPSIECTEVALACGTALEHGVMLSRIWVTEEPEEVARLVGWEA